MGYTTQFTGRVTVTPPLNRHEITYLRRFSDSRRMDRANGPYYAEPGRNFGQTHEPDVYDFNRPPEGQPELWCQWVPTADGTGLEWNGKEKFYSAAEWMRYLIDTFLRPGAALRRELREPVSGRVYDKAFRRFTFSHVVNGVIDAEGEEPDDIWRLVVRDNTVLRQDMSLPGHPETAV